MIFATDNGDGLVRQLFADGATKIMIDSIGGCVALLVHENILYVGSWTDGTVTAYQINW